MKLKQKNKNMNGIKILTRLTLGFAVLAALIYGVAYIKNDNLNGTLGGFLGGTLLLGFITFIGLILALVISSIKNPNK